MRGFCPCSPLLSVYLVCRDSKDISSWHWWHIASSLTHILGYIKFQSVSAFAPITNPINCPWGQKAFSNYLGSTKADWEVLFSLDIIDLSVIYRLLINVFLQEYDASCLIRKSKEVSTPILIDQVCGNGLAHALVLPSCCATMPFISSYCSKHGRNHWFFKYLVYLFSCYIFIYK